MHWPEWSGRPIGAEILQGPLLMLACRWSTFRPMFVLVCARPGKAVAAQEPGGTGFRVVAAASVKSLRWPGLDGAGSIGSTTISFRNVSGLRATAIVVMAARIRM